MKKHTIQTSTPHAIMFHHFYTNTGKQPQGAISPEQFRYILDNYPGNIIPAREWYEKAVSGVLDANDVCLTFDDALLCQYEIAHPILQEYGLTAFWFVYSSVLIGEIEMLEVYRKFRTEHFDSIDDFYKAFFNIADILKEQMKDYTHDDWKQYPFYTENDTKFRHIRDNVLGVQRHNGVMHDLMDEFNIDIYAFTSNLWMIPNNIVELHSKENIIGMHSHTHPTSIGGMGKYEQMKEYQKNHEVIRNILGKRPVTMSHPCNSYNTHTLSLLQNLGIQVGFRADMVQVDNVSRLEFPRQDHANIIRSMQI